MSILLCPMAKFQFIRLLLNWALIKYIFFFEKVGNVHVSPQTFVYSLKSGSKI